MEKTPYLEITVVSAEDLQIRGRLIKKNAFVTVRTNSSSCQSTSIDREGGGYPSWNEKLQLHLPPYNQPILVEVQCKTSTGLKTIGTVSIPMSEIVNDYVPADCLHLRSYRLRERGGERNGIINLSIKTVGSKDVKRPALPPSIEGQEFVHRRIPTVHQPAPAVMGTRCSDGIAIGIPVSYGYRV